MSDREWELLRDLGNEYHWAQLISNLKKKKKEWEETRNEGGI